MGNVSNLKASLQLAQFYVIFFQIRFVVSISRWWDSSAGYQPARRSGGERRNHTLGQKAADKLRSGVRSEEVNKDIGSIFFIFNFSFVWRDSSAG
jgi:hypothetical protein